MIEIRAAIPADIPAMVELRHERALLQRLRLAPNARETAAMDAQNWMDDADFAIFVAVNDNQLIGYIVGKVQSAARGLFLERNGVISELVLDLHQYQGGIGRLLFDALREWYRSCNVARIFVSMPQRSPVEQAFWRALGAVKWTEGLWIT